MEFQVETAPYGRRPPVRRLSRHRRRTRLEALGGFFLFRFFSALPEDPVEALAALFEPLRKAFRLLARIVVGPGVRGGWGSEAGCFLLAAHEPYWVRDALRWEEVEILLALDADGGLSLRTPWQEDEDCVRFTPTGARTTPRPRRRRRRVDIAFGDGSWVAVRTLTPHTATRLREGLDAGQAGVQMSGNGRATTP